MNEIPLNHLYVAFGISVIITLISLRRSAYLSGVIEGHALEKKAIQAYVESLIEDINILREQANEKVTPAPFKEVFDEYQKVIHSLREQLDSSREESGLLADALLHRARIITKTIQAEATPSTEEQ